jgi:glutamate N-acetyltransferase/amino-acid N-acetyltransferase
MTRPVQGGVTAPLGFRAAGVHCGIKPKNLDLALLAPDRPASAAGVFTTNKVQAAPVLVSKEHLARGGGLASAIAINSGCANACTGSAGLAAARDMAAAAARAVGCVPEQVLVASTGVIGVLLDAAKVTAGVAAAATRLSHEGHADAARAIMTTDPWPKSCAVEMEAGGLRFTVGGMAKGSGMIEPNLATMLACLTTDAAVAPSRLQRALSEAVADTFNAITVDGECSTNDTVFALASGASGISIDDGLHDTLVEGLRAVSRELAVAIVRGGEGATKLVTVRVTGARSDAEARQAAHTIANSPLVKTAIHGGDPNWGRLVAAAGRAGVAFALERAAVRVGGVELFLDGVAHDDRAPQAAERLQQPEIDIEVNVGAGGPHSATVWTCDLSAEYVRINADYRT